MHDSIASPEGDLNPSSYAIKAWLCAAIFRMKLYPKAMYMPLGVDQSTWSRWTSLEHDQTPPSGMMPAILALLDDQAFYDYCALIRPRISETGDNIIPTTKKPGVNRAS
jgi:hypothetical protein